MPNTEALFYFMSGTGNSYRVACWLDEAAKLSASLGEFRKLIGPMQLLYQRERERKRGPYSFPV